MSKQNKKGRPLTEIGTIAQSIVKVPEEQTTVVTVGVLGISADIALLADDAALTRRTDEYIAEMNAGTPQEKLAKCKQILLLGKGTEKISLMIGAAIEEIRSQMLWSKAITGEVRADGTGYADADSFIREMFPNYTDERLEQLHLGYVGYRKYNAACARNGWTPQGELDTRPVRETQTLVYNELKRNRGNMSADLRNKFRQAAGLEESAEPLADAELSTVSQQIAETVIDRGTAKRKQQITLKPKLAESKQGIKPSYSQMMDAKSDVLIALGMKKAPESKDTTTSANQGTPAPAPNNNPAPRLPEKVFQDYLFAVHAAQEQGKSILRKVVVAESGIHKVVAVMPLDEPRAPDLADYFAKLSPAMKKLLLEHCAKLGNLVAEFQRSLEHHYKPIVKVGDKVVQTDKSGAVLEDEEDESATDGASAE